MPNQPNCFIFRLQRQQIKNIFAMDGNLREIKKKKNRVKQLTYANYVSAVKTILIIFFYECSKTR